MKVSVTYEKLEDGFKASVKKGFKKSHFADKNLDSLLKTVNGKVKTLMGVRRFER